MERLLFLEKTKCENRADAWNRLKKMMKIDDSDLIKDWDEPERHCFVIRYAEPNS